jgi:hypothetical protein
LKQLTTIIFLSLLSAQSFAGVGDLYNCEETSAVTSLNDGYISNQNTTLSNFSFRRNKSEIVIETPYISTITTLSVTSSKDEEFTAFHKDKSENGFEYLTYKNGVYINTTKVTGSDYASVMTIIAKCKISKL